MASYHLSVKTVKSSAGRSATAAAAYRSASVIELDREGRMHDYTAKRGVEACFILAPMTFQIGRRTGPRCGTPPRRARPAPIR